MPWVAAVGAVVGGAVSSMGASDAADTQADASRDAIAAGNAQFAQTREDQKRYRESGYGALNKLNDLLGLSGNTSADGYGSMSKPFTGASVASDPGYQFGLSQGTRAIDNSAASHGGLYSGATLKALTRYGNDYGTTKFTDAFNRDQTQNNTLANKLQSVAGLGQTSLGQTGSLGAVNAANAGQNMIGAGNAQAAAGLAGTNATVGAINQIGSYAKSAWPGGSTYSHGYGSGSNGSGNYVNQGTYGGDVNGSYWGTE